MPLSFPTHRRLLWACSLAFVICTQLLPASLGASNGVKLTRFDDRVRVDVDGELLTEYVFKGAPHVYLYPVIGPDGIPMTRNAPMKPAPDEDTDHPHHRSVWFSHGNMNGVDFWAESAKAGRIELAELNSVKSGKSSGSLKASHRWVSKEGEVICTDTTLWTFHRRQDGQKMMDVEITLSAPRNKPLVFGDTKEGTMGVRLAETMRLKPNKFNTGKPPGKIVLSTGETDAATWGKRAAWCDYTGLVQGREVGLAIFDHPSNPRHPTWWHVRDYGLFAANPFGIHDFEKKPAGTGDLTVPAGGSVTFRYRLYWHRGNHLAADVAKEFSHYAARRGR